MYKKFIKPLFDLFFSSFLILLLSPVLILISLLIFIFMGRPIMFNQIRPGLNKTPFKMYKFRTMITSNNLNDESRITNLGLILRRLSLDELPQLFNVFFGNMSLIGPRPLLTEYNEYYSDLENKRFFVKPGISGLAQVSGRNTLTWERKLNYDVEYAENLTFLMDMKIFFSTILVVLTFNGFKKSGENQNFIESKKTTKKSYNSEKNG